ncbi:MAG: hypothetical protein J0H01_33940 [Rhizobiales bacterium]|nr:hypothetical protein [Hyphomicrobiales bacterium]
MIDEFGTRLTLLPLVVGYFLLLTILVGLILRYPVFSLPAIGFALMTGAHFAAMSPISADQNGALYFSLFGLGAIITGIGGMTRKLLASNASDAMRDSQGKKQKK